MPNVAGRQLSIVVLSFALLLTAFAARYGYHRDELYFLAAGKRLDLGYPDQPPLTPLIARAMSAIDADSILVLRLPGILAALVAALLLFGPRKVTGETSGLPARRDRVVRPCGC